MTTNPVNPTTARTLEAGLTALARCRPLTLLLAALTALCGLAVLATPAQAGQVGVTVTLYGRGSVEAVEGRTASDPQSCHQLQTSDPAKSHTCPRWRSEATFEAWMWFRPSPGGAGDDGWALASWSGCDKTRTRDGTTECGVGSSAFGSSEKQVELRFVDIAAPPPPTLTVTLVPGHQGLVEWRVMSPTSVRNAACRFDDGPWFECVGLGRTVLPEGRHTMSATVTDLSGQTSTAAGTAFSVVDTTVVSAPAALSRSRTAEVTVTSTGDRLRCRLDDEAAPRICSDRLLTHVVTLADLADGPHRLELSAEDGDWKDVTPAVVEWTVDTTAPTTQVALVGVRQNTTVDVQVTAAEPGTSECRVTLESDAPGPWHACPRGTSTFAGLAGGGQVFEARSTDAAGNVGPIARYRHVVRPDGPAIEVTRTTAGPGSATLRVSAPDAVLVSCRLTSLGAPGPWLAPCPSPMELSDLAPGAHVLEVVAQDDWGNRTIAPVVHRWTTTGPDTTAPETRLVGGPATGSVDLRTSVTFSVGAVDSNGEATQVRCTLDGAARPCTGGRLSLARLAPGTHRVTAAAVDAAGNVDATPAERVWTVPMDDRALKAGRGWKRVRSARAFGGTALSARTPGAEVTTTVRAARAVALVAAPGPGGGRVSVYAGSRLLRTLVLPTSRNATVLPTLRLPTPFTGTLRVRVAGRGRTVQLDALAVVTR